MGEGRAVPCFPWWPICCPGRAWAGRSLLQAGTFPRTPSAGTFQDSMTCLGGSAGALTPPAEQPGAFMRWGLPDPPWRRLQLREGSGGSYVRSSGWPAGPLPSRRAAALRPDGSVGAEGRQ